MNDENHQQNNDNPIGSNDSKPITTSSETLTNQMLSLTNQNDVTNILNLQTEISSINIFDFIRLKKQYETNHMLSHFNEYSSQKYNQMSGDFEKHTKMLKEMKKDLDYIFKKTRNLQILLNEKFQIPGISDQYNGEDEEDED
ncbi:hypothetical protein RB653_006803 [Dictyostelium firmibasis]|uniref:KxDL domain-containing protein n=1 Tax=Dictyostelium firmibasis TaxID=79012 RepID=A0AAN7U063_9MYCE